MKALVIYESFFGNTKLVAEAISKGLADQFEVETVEVDAANPDLDVLDLLVIGGPTHAWGMSRKSTRTGAREQAAEKQIEPQSKGRGIRELIHDVPRHPGGPLVATFDTKLTKPKWLPKGSAAGAAAKRLQRRGFEMPIEPEQFEVTESEGPLAEGELERAEAWGRELAETAAAMLAGSQPVPAG